MWDARLFRRVLPHCATPAVVLIVAVAVTFSQALFSDRVFFERDVHAYWYPHRAVIEQALSEGSWPLWNPYVRFGVPLLADPNFEIAYPPTWIGLLFSPALHYKLFAIGHTLLAAAGAWALARRLGMRRGAAAVAGATYALSGPMLSAVDLFHHHVGAAWVPWVLWALEGLLRAPSTRRTLVLAVVTAAQIVAGSGDMCLVAALAGLGRIGWAFFRPRRFGAAPLVSVFAYAGTAAALALAIGAVQWLPTAAIAGDAVRLHMSPEASTGWSLHPASLLEIAVPRAVSGLPLSDPARRAFFEGREPFLKAVYLGTVPLGLALLAIALRSRAALAAGGGFLFFMLASLGRHTPFYGALLLIPGVSILRYPQKFLLPAALCLALMTALGFEAWTRPWSADKRRRGRLVGIALLGWGLAATFAALALWSRPELIARWVERDAVGFAAHASALKLLRTALSTTCIAFILLRRTHAERAASGLTVALVVAGALDLVAVGKSINDLAPPEILARPAIVNEIAPGSRVHATDEGFACRQPAPTPPGWHRSWVAAQAFQSTLRAPTAARWGLFGSFDGEFSGLGSEWSALFEFAAYRLQRTPPGLRLDQLSNVSRVLHVGTTVPAGLRLLERRPSPYACPLLVLEVSEPLGRAYTVHHERAASGPETTLIALLDPRFDPRNDVVVPPPERTASGDTSPQSDEVEVQARTLNTLEIRVRASANATLVVVEAYAPGWQVRVDGRRSAIIRANGLFRGVRLTPGQHHVVFSYRPRAVIAGSIVSVAGMLFSATLAIRSRPSRRRPRRSS